MSNAAAKKEAGKPWLKLGGNKKQKPLSRRQMKKARKQILHESRIARLMREDVVAPEKISPLTDAEERLKQAYTDADESAFRKAFDDIVTHIKIVYPAKGSPKIRENVEILAVAIAVAMGFRTYFIQPFKIPTGSMQPTLFGITVKTEDKDGKRLEPGLFDRFPLSVVKFLWTGRTYKEVHAKQSGTVGGIEKVDQRYFLVVGNTRHRWYNDMVMTVSPNSFVRKGELIGYGEVKQGDHILVNKVKYNFFPPKRGEIIVFNTENIDAIEEKTFYIKRLVGLPGDQLSIRPTPETQAVGNSWGKLHVNGEELTRPKHFTRWDYGYADRYAAKLGEPTDVLELKEREYAAFGDNTMSSLDSRYFGTVPQDNLVGPAFAIYWPFWKRFGPANNTRLDQQHVIPKSWW